MEGESRRHMENFIDQSLGRVGHAPSGIGCQRVEIAPRSLGIEHAQGQRRFARPRDAGKTHNGMQGDFDIDIFEIMNTRTFDGDGLNQGNTSFTVMESVQKSVNLSLPVLLKNGDFAVAPFVWYKAQATWIPN